MVPILLLPQPTTSTTADQTGLSGGSSALTNATSTTTAPTSKYRPEVDRLFLFAVRVKNEDKRLLLEQWERCNNEDIPSDFECVNYLGTVKLRDMINLQEFFISNSAILLISVPIFVWDLLPRDSPAYTFIGYIKSSTKGQLLEATQSRTAQEVRDNTAHEMMVDVLKEKSAFAHQLWYSEPIKALSIQDEVVERFNRLPLKDYPGAASYADVLASMRMYLDLLQATRVLQESQVTKNTRSKARGEGHPKTLIALRKLERVYLLLGFRSEAKEIRSRIIRSASMRDEQPEIPEPLDVNEMLNWNTTRGYSAERFVETLIEVKMELKPHEN